MTAPVELRPYRDGDGAGITRLLDESAPALYRQTLNGMHGPGRDEPSRWRTTVAAGPDGEVRAAVTLAHHSVHRGQYVLVVQVGPAYRRQGLGRALVAAGRRMRTEPLPITARFFESDAASAALARSLGAEIVQRAPGFRLDPAALRGWADAQPVPPGVVLDDLTAVAATDLAAAWLDLYVWLHEGWTAPPLSIPALVPALAADVAGTDRQGSSGAWIDGRLAAFAAAVDDHEGGVMVVTETVRRDEPDGTRLVAAVVADCLRRLADRGVRVVTLDGHVTDPHLHPVTQSLPPTVRTDPLLVARID